MEITRRRKKNALTFVINIIMRHIYMIISSSVMRNFHFRVYANEMHYKSAIIDHFLASASWCYYIIAFIFIWEKISCVKKKQTLGCFFSFLFVFFSSPAWAMFYLSAGETNKSLHDLNIHLLCSNKTLATFEMKRTSRKEVESVAERRALQLALLVVLLLCCYLFFFTSVLWCLKVNDQATGLC